ncbi:TPA: HEAT repeat domain-containing protein, partial [Candidatus Micrarchaeota archaeon]|nr:HEAT repeat domain-containing protein [Candidatus Micrarchaeota archaeon]
MMTGAENLIRELGESGVPGNKMLIIRQLGKYSGDDVVAALERELEGWNRLVKRAAVEALGRCSNGRAVGILRGQLQSPNEIVRAEAIISLGKRLGREFARELVAMPIGEHDYDVRQAASKVLAKHVDIDGAGRKITELLVGTGDFDIRRSVFAALGKCGDDVTPDKLVEELTGRHNVLNYKLAGKALGKRAGRGDERAFQALVDAIESGERHSVRGAVIGLGISGRPEALEPLSRAFEKSDMEHEIEAVMKAVEACGGRVSRHLRTYPQSRTGYEYIVWDANDQQVTPRDGVPATQDARQPEAAPEEPEAVPEPPKELEPVKPAKEQVTKAATEAESIDYSGMSTMDR